MKGGGALPTVRKLHSKVCRQKSRTWGRHTAPCGDQNRLMVYWGGKERQTWKGHGVLVYLRERLWRVSDISPTGQWLDQLGWRRRNLTGENRLATKKFRAKSIPSLATLQNLSNVPRAFALSILPFLSFISSFYFFKTYYINPKSFLELGRIKEKERKKTKKGRKADG